MKKTVSPVPRPGLVLISSMVLILWGVLCVLGLVSGGGVITGRDYVELGLKIHIALTIDETSSKDVLIVANSVVLSTYHPASLVFHVAVCGKTIQDAETLAVNIKRSFEYCMPHIATDIRPFMLPPDSGFAQQRDHVSTEKRSHWFSPTGADMARFFLASIFPDVDKLLYLDNDIVVSCCVEEVYHTVLDGNKIAGIALDDLKWATVTQFQRQYNASHPLVIKNIRRPKDNAHNDKPIDLTSPVDENEFWKALPRYPNDGVLLIDVKKYNAGNILAQANEIALANARGEYVVGMGTQQFTVLMLHDRWVELTPRANLRHFPDMARGYLMWFYYNGIIHYAGMAKPRVVCNNEGSDNEHRIGSYTPWANTVHNLVQQCPAESLIADIRQCAAHIPEPSSPDMLLRFIKSIANANAEPAVIVMHVGAIGNDVVSSSEYEGVGVAIPGSNSSSSSATEADNTLSYGQAHVEGRMRHQHPRPHHGHAQHRKHHINTINNQFADTPKGSEPLEKPLSIMTSVMRYVLYHGPWSVRIFDAAQSRLDTTNQKFQASLSSNNNGLNITSFIKEKKQSGRRILRGKNAPKKSWTDSTHKSPSNRYFMTTSLNFCDGYNDYIGFMPSSSKISDGQCSKDSFIPSYEQNARVNAYESNEICRSLLQHIKATGNKHWEVIGITIDYQPTAQKPWSSSLGVLRNMDLVFLRPKFVVVKIGSPQLHIQAASAGSQAMDSCRNPRGQRTLLDDAKEARQILQRSGYQAFIDNTNSCDSPSDTVGASGSDHGEHLHDQYICVWGTRLTTLEFGNQERWA
jgi:lipopolysaccharide biosynthesis glycosyltransferase